jgi:hypothetical protein
LSQIYLDEALQGPMDNGAASACMAPEGPEFVHTYIEQVIVGDFPLAWESLVVFAVLPLLVGLF